MNSVLIYTRSYIKPDGQWNMSLDCINSIRKVLEVCPDNSVRWEVLVSNQMAYKLKELDEVHKAMYRLRKDFNSRVNVTIVNERLSCSQARAYFFKMFMDAESNPVQEHFNWFIPSYYMNLDSDDSISNPEGLKAFIESDEKTEDLIAFGLDVSPESIFYKDWHWDLDKFIKSRRYITTETQTMFLFLHTLDVIKYITSSGDYFKGRPIEDPNESCEDCLMTLDIAKWNHECPHLKFTISAMCLNLIKYTEYESQSHNRQQDEYKSKLSKDLLKYGYLYVNGGNFYKLDESGKLVKFDPYNYK